MNRSISVWVVAIVLSLVATNIVAAQSQTQPLGDYARAVKKGKRPPDAKTAPKVYDNDNLPASTSISVVGDSSSSDQKNGDSQDQDKAKNPDGTKKQDDSSGEKKPEPKLKEGQSAEERQKALDHWKDKLGEQKDKISLVSRELDVLQRERQLKFAEFYSDTARRTQNPNGFVDEDAKYKQQIADKQKQLDDAKGKLNDMQDDARKSGAPNSVIE